MPKLEKYTTEAHGTRKRCFIFFITCLTLTVVTFLEYSLYYTEPEALEDLDLKINPHCRDVQLKPTGSFPTVALASFPGSGNTWLRYLIERATGYYTGAIYNDRNLYKNGFLGELEPWTNGTTVVVKTHKRDEEHIKVFHGAILIIRDPCRAMLAYHNLKFGAGHTGFAPEGQYKGQEWVSFVKKHSLKWADTVINYLQYSKQVLVIYYEELLTDLYTNLVKIVTFLGLPVDEERLLCVLGNHVGKFKRPPDERKQLSESFDSYTKKMRESINLYIKQASETERSKTFSHKVLC